MFLDFNGMLAGYMRYEYANDTPYYPAMIRVIRLMSRASISYYEKRALCFATAITFKDKALTRRDCHRIIENFKI